METEAQLSYVKGHRNTDEWNEPGFVFLDKFAETLPDKDAFVFRPDAKTRKAITYKTLSENTRKLGIWFMKNFSLENGDCAGILSLNSMEFLLADLALSRLGVVVVRQYVTMDSRVELTRALVKTECRMFLCQSASLNSARAIAKEAPEKLQHILILDNQISCTDFTTLPNVNELQYTIEDYEELKRREKKIEMSDDCTIYSTSGSTGEPKYVVYSYRTAVNYARMIQEKGGFDANDRYFNDRPMAHVAGSPLKTIPFGATMIVANPWKTVQGSDSYLSIIFNEENITAGVSFPYILHDLLQSSKITAPIKYLIVGGQRVNERIMTSIRQNIDAKFLNAYGTTEMGEIASTSKSDSLEILTKFVGLPFPGVEIKIVNDSGDIVPVGEIGRIAIRKEREWRYLNNEDKMKEVHDKEGFFYPGDTGRMNEDNFLEILGRDDDRMSVGTVKIYPTGTEMTLCSNPAVDKAIVFGVPDERLYEVIGAAILPKIRGLTSSDVIEYFSQSVNEADLMAGDVIMPKHVWILDKFPLTTSGKVDKKALKKLCIERLSDVSQ